MKETYIHGFKVKYEDNTYGAVGHLRDDLDFQEAKVFFDQAKLKKSVNFEDDQDINYTLSYSSDNTFTLIRRA